MACTCDAKDLAAFGCKCGEMERERAAMNQQPPTAYDQAIWQSTKQFYDAIDRDPLAEVKADPAVLFRANGMEPDPAQIELLNCKDKNVLVLWTRQFGGKSQTAATIALHTAMTNLGLRGQGSTTLVFSSTQRESIELLRKIRFLRYGLMNKHVGTNKQQRKWKPRSAAKDIDRWGKLFSGEAAPLPPELDATTDAQTMIELENGSRIISLPAHSKTVVGYTVDLLILDEAKLIPDEFYSGSVRPMLATTKGRMMAFTTPLGQRGWFYEAWKKCDEAKMKGDAEPYRRFRRTCWECPRHDKEFLDLERTLIGEYWFKQEYECNPPDAPVWMGDFSFKPLGEVRTGDVVVGWKRMLAVEGSAYGKDWLCRSKVLGVRKRRSNIVKVALESGRALRCTPDHKWLSFNSDPRDYWAKYRAAQVGDCLVHIIDQSPLLPEHLVWDAAWLGGIYDGEGHWNHIAQSKSHNPKIHERIDKVLRSLGFRIGSHKMGFYFLGGRQGFVDFLAWTKPTKCDKYMQRSILGAHFKQRDRVVSIEPDGSGDVVSMQTTTGNYIVWGYASKNCAFLDPVGAIFRGVDIERAMRPPEQPVDEIEVPW